MKLHETHTYWPLLTKPIRDPAFIEVLKTIKEISFSNSRFTFEERFRHIKKFEKLVWTLLSKYFGVDKLSNFYIINGITDYIDTFLQNIKTIGLFPNEYLYYKEISLQRNIDIIDISNVDNIPKCDKIALSCPYSFNGDTWFQQEVIDTASQYNIPILIDCAYLGLTSPWYINLAKSKNISIAYSMSKHYSLSFDRIGIVFTSNLDQKLQVLNQFGYVNISGIEKANLLLENFDENFIYNKYSPMYKDIIEKLGLNPTGCILFGHKKTEKYCITEHYLNTSEYGLS